VAVAGIVTTPAIWPWALGSLFVNHLALGYFGMSPRSRLLGPNVVRLPKAAMDRGEVALTFDDGPNPRVTPAILDALDRHAARASFFCIGERAAAHPDLIQEIAARGHSVENHSHTHPNGFAGYPPSWLVWELRRAQETIMGITGRAPEFFRPPMGLRSPLLDPVLSRLGLRHVSWTRRGYDAVDTDQASVVRRLTQGLAAGDVLLLHDGNGTHANNDRSITLEVLSELLHRMASIGLRSVSLPEALH
jgi:peptidoglycan/xylan/chitin deacetylase (PgdA/CDA1 family)